MNNFKPAELEEENEKQNHSLLIIGLLVTVICAVCYIFLILPTETSEKKEKVYIITFQDQTWKVKEWNNYGTSNNICFFDEKGQKVILAGNFMVVETIEK